MANTLLTAMLTAATLSSATVLRRDLVVQTSGSWTSLGCYSDTQSSRTLSVTGMLGDNVSDLSCQATCQKLGYVYAGTEYAGQCFCDNTINKIAVQKPDSDCNMACTGDATQPCGGPDRINLFWNGTTIDAPMKSTSASASASVSASASASSKALPTGWKALGCLTDAVGARALSNYIVGPSTGMTVEYCTQGCAAAGYTYGGVEYANECYCGNTIQNGHSLASDGCNMACSGDSTEICGGPNRLSLYGTSMPDSPVSSSAAASSSTVASSSAPAVTSSAPLSSSTEASSAPASSSTVASSSAPVVVSSAPASSSEMFSSSAPAAISSESAGISSSAPAAASSEPAAISSSAPAAASSEPAAISSSAPAAVLSSSAPAIVSSESAAISSSAPVIVSSGSAAISSASAAVSSSAPAAISSSAPAIVSSAPAAVSSSAPAIVSSASAAISSSAPLVVSSSASAAVSSSAPAVIPSSVSAAASSSIPAVISSAPASSSVPPSSSAAAAASSSAAPLRWYPQTTGLPTSWSYDSCRIYVRMSTLDFLSKATASLCIDKCEKGGYKVAALVQGTYCGCGSLAQVAPQPVLDVGRCDAACYGDTRFACGGYPYNPTTKGMSVYIKS